MGEVYTVSRSLFQIFGQLSNTINYNFQALQKVCQNCTLISRARAGEAAPGFLREDRNLCINSQQLQRKCAFSLTHMLSVLNNTESDRQVWNCVQGSDSLPSCSQRYKEHALQAHPWERMPSCGGKAPLLNPHSHCLGPNQLS